MASPGHGVDDEAMGWASHPRRVGLQVGDGGTEVNRPPARPTLTENEARCSAVEALALAPARADLHHLPLLVDLHALDRDRLQPEQARP